MLCLLWGVDAMTAVARACDALCGRVGTRSSSTLMIVACLRLRLVPLLSSLYPRVFVGICIYPLCLYFFPLFVYACVLCVLSARLTKPTKIHFKSILFFPLVIASLSVRICGILNVWKIDGNVEPQHRTKFSCGLNAYPRTSNKLRLGRFCMVR